MFTDMASPRTLTEVRTYTYVSCDYTMTATAQALIAGNVFSADLVTYTFLNPSQPLVVTWHYPEVTLSSLTPLESITFVWYHS
jgi:hypothetical protein